MLHCNLRPAIAALAAVMFVAGCQQAGFGRRPVQVAVAPQPVAPVEPVGFTPAALNGTWKPSGGAAAGEYVAVFQDGRFVSRDPNNADREALLAQGTYTTTGTQQVNIDFVGVVSGRNVQADCNLATPQTLACTPTVGPPFTLVRA